MSQVNDSLNILREKGVIYGEVQVERLTEQYAICLANSNNKGAELIKELEIISEHVTEHNLLFRRTIEIQEELNRVNNVCDLIQIDSDFELTNMFIINKAYPADKKTFPIRWLVVFLSTFSILIASIIILRCIELYNIQKMTNKLIQNSIVFFFTILFGFFLFSQLQDGKWWLISIQL